MMQLDLDLMWSELCFQTNISANWGFIALNGLMD